MQREDVALNLSATIVTYNDQAEALRAAAQEKEERMGALSGGMNLPGMF